MKLKVLINILLICIFVSMLGMFYVLCYKKTGDVSKINIPSYSSLIVDWASLNLQNALAFKSDINAGAIYFTSANRDNADYVILLLSKTDTGKFENLRRKTGSVSMNSHDSQIIRDGIISFYWQPPTNIYITNGVQEAAIISISEIALINEGKFNNIEWTSTKKSNR